MIPVPKTLGNRAGVSPAALTGEHPQAGAGGNSGPWAGLVYGDRLEAPKVLGETKETVRADVSHAVPTGEHLRQALG